MEKSADHRYDVFISYSHKDRAFVSKLAKDLEGAAGMSVFYDAKILPGDDWEQSIKDALEASRSFLPVLSPSYLDSQLTLEELNTAEERGQSIVPIMFQPCNAPPRIWRLRYADFTNPNEYPAKLKELITALNSRRGWKPPAPGVTVRPRTRGVQESPQPVFNYPPELIKAISAGECVLYAGAGLSAIAGFPVWREFAKSLLDDANRRELKTSLPPSVLESAWSEGKTDFVVDTLVEDIPRLELDRFLAATFQKEVKLPETHRILGRLPFSAALTTNFDDLLEATFPEAKRFTPSDTDAILNTSSKQEQYLLKLYGTLSVPETVLVSPAQFEDAIVRNLPFTQFIESLFVSHTILFVGCSLEGIDAYLRGLRFRSKPTRPHFALAGVLGTSWQAMGMVMKRRYGIEVIPYWPNESDHLLAAIKTLESEVSSVKKSQRSLDEPLRRLVLDNIGPFTHLELDLRDGFNVLLGNNGTGKSTILRAIAVALCGAESGARAADILKGGQTTGTILLEIGRTQYQTILQRTGSGTVEITSSPMRPLEPEGWLALGFPPLRQMSAGLPGGPGPDGPSKPVATDILPLAGNTVDERLFALKQWIINRDYDDAKSKKSPGKSVVKFAFQIIGELVEDMKVEFLEVKKSVILVETDDGTVPLERISQGTASLIGWIGVLLQRLFEIHGALTNPVEHYVLVLMDEIDAHMHPSWQRVLLPRVKKVFPKMQLIATTHSPLIINGLDCDDVIVVKREAGKLGVRRYEMQLAGLEPAQILTSPLFDVQDTRDESTEKKEEQYKHLLQLKRPTARQTAQRSKLAAELFGVPETPSQSKPVASKKRKPVRGGR